jgi:hypothetical protein
VSEISASMLQVYQLNPHHTRHSHESQFWGLCTQKGHYSDGFRPVNATTG